MIRADSITLAPGETVNILPNGDLNMYDIKMVFNPAVIKILNIISRVPPFNKITGKILITLISEQDLITL